MIRELENFTIRSEQELDYFDETADYIAENENRILKFFKLDKLPQKVDIEIVNYEDFKKYYASKGWKLYDYSRGVSNYRENEKEIKMLNLRDQRIYTTHKASDVDEFKTTTLHEVVHECHSFVHKKASKDFNWMKEGLATNLSNQKFQIGNLNYCNFEKLKTDFYNCKYGYAFAYTLVRYIIENYPEDEAQRLYREPDYLRERADSIFEEAKEWVSKKIKKDDIEIDR